MIFLVETAYCVGLLGIGDKLDGANSKPFWPDDGCLQPKLVAKNIKQY